MKKNISGFTLVELVITVALSALLAGVAMPIYNGFSDSIKLDEAVNTVFQELQLAQKMSASGKDRSAFGIYLDETDNSLTFYQGVNYAERNIDSERRTDLDSNIVLENKMFSDDVNFSSGRGTPNEVGEISLYFKDEVRNITINDYGLIFKD